MVPVVQITGSVLNAQLLYVAFLGCLLLVATLIRLKVPILKKYYIPASLIAGLMGLLLGPYFLKVVPQEITSSWASISGVLMTIVLAPAMMGAASIQKKGMYKKALSAACFTYSVTGMQFCVPMLLTMLIFTPLMGVSQYFPATFEAGWAGGHGVASALTPIFEEIGWTEGTSLCIVNSTVGLLVGVFVGVVLINIAVRKGYTKVLKTKTDIENANVELYTGDNRPVDTRASTNASVIDTFAFTAAVISLVLVLGYALMQVLNLIKFPLPWFCTSVFAGFFVQKVILNNTKWGQAVDRASISRIQGLALEFVIAGGMASLNMTVVLQYAVPIIITSAALALLMVWYVMWYGKRTLGYYWFETAIILFGAFCGVAATGMVLLKTCDPELKSDAAEIYAARLIFTGFATGGGVITILAPRWISQFGTPMCTLAFGALWIIALVLPWILRLNKFKGVDGAAA